MATFKSISHLVMTSFLEVLVGRLLLSESVDFSCWARLLLSKTRQVYQYNMGPETLREVAHRLEINRSQFLYTPPCIRSYWHNTLPDMAILPWSNIYGSVLQGGPTFWLVREFCKLWNITLVLAHMSQLETWPTFSRVPTQSTKVLLSYSEFSTENCIFSNFLFLFLQYMSRKR